MKFLENTIVRVALTLLVFCVTFAIVLHVANVDLMQLGSKLLATNFAIASISIPFVLISHLLRAWRWKTMLRPVKEQTSLLNLFSAVMLGYAANNIIPRSGEFLRPFAFSRREKISLSKAIASVVIERFVDILNLLLFMAIALFFVGERLQSVLPKYNLQSITRSVAISAVGLLLVLLILVLTPAAEWILRVAVKPFSRALHDKAASAFGNFKSGLEILKKPSEYPLLAIQSCLIWLFYILPVYVMFVATPDPLIHSLSFLDACIVLLVMAIATTLTPPLPGAFIFIPTVLVTAMIPLFGVSKEEAMAYSMLTFMLNYIPVTIIGGLFMLREQVRPSQHAVDDSSNELPSDSGAVSGS